MSATDALLLAFAGAAAVLVLFVVGLLRAAARADRAADAEYQREAEARWSK